ncbi:MAG: phage holin family protein [Oscillospiraceae bacterium]|nr:phage holin family protein [Oscillospiraceae bacterium]
MLDNIVHSPFIKTLAIVICLDTVLGILRSFKQRKLNSAFGINGCIRKTAMLVSVVTLGVIDKYFLISSLGLIPEEIEKYFPDIGLSAFFAILFIVFESLSILKNMQLCGLPIPKKLQQLAKKFLDKFTDELPKK